MSSGRTATGELARAVLEFSEQKRKRGVAARIGAAFHHSTSGPGSHQFPGGGRAIAGEPTAAKSQLGQLQRFRRKFGRYQSRFERCC